MSDIDWNQFFFGKEPLSFLLEIFFRTTIMYVVILIALRSSGRRGVKQLSVFETVIIIGLGTAAGDPMIYKEIGIVYSVTVFFVLIGLYRLTIYYAARNNFIEKILEGEPRILVKDGMFNIEEFDREHLSHDEFFSELRMQNVEHLGQVRTALLETSGGVSILFHSDENVEYGLPLLIDLNKQKAKEILGKNHYACANCGKVEELSSPAECKVCQEDEWVEATNALRIG